MIINQNQVEAIEAALLVSSDYIADNIEAICDDDYLKESKDVISQVKDALDLLRNLKEDETRASSCHDDI